MYKSTPQDRKIRSIERQLDAIELRWDVALALESVTGAEKCEAEYDGLLTEYRAAVMGEQT